MSVSPVTSKQVNDAALEARRAAYQLTIERIAIVSLSVILTIAAFVIAGAPPSTTFQRFQADFGDWLSPRLFSAVFLLGAVIAPLLLQGWARRLDVVYRRQLYMLCAGSLILYTLPIGWVALRTGTGGLGAIIYVILFVLFAVIALATYRE